MSKFDGYVGASDYDCLIATIRCCDLPYCIIWSVLFFFFNDTATTEIYTLSLHDALPISQNYGDAYQHHIGGFMLLGQAFRILLEKTSKWR